jgi:hypothetical protein
MHLFAQDRDRLLARLRRKIRKRFEVPAEVVEDIIQLHGYRIESSQYLPSSMLGCCHFDDKLVLIPESLAIRLRHPQSAPKVVRSVLAHELGHIRLHARRARAGEREAVWEDEADHYAQVFLVPWPQLMARREVILLTRSIWGPLTKRKKSYAKDLRTASMAEICRVGPCSVSRRNRLSS